MKCPHCQTPLFRTISIKVVVTLTKAVLVIVFILTVSGIVFNKITAKKNINCSAFKTQEEAQATFDSDRIKYKRLDSNNDLVACEDLINQ